MTTESAKMLHSEIQNTSCLVFAAPFIGLFNLNNMYPTELWGHKGLSYLLF